MLRIKWEFVLQQRIVRISYIAGSVNITVIIVAAGNLVWQLNGNQMIFVPVRSGG